jgi:hypothetical protein
MYRRRDDRLANLPMHGVACQNAHAARLVRAVQVAAAVDEQERPTMTKLKVAIACQGGGSQTAFTAGALKALCEEQIAREFDIVAISGTRPLTPMSYAGVARRTTRREIYATTPAVAPVYVAPAPACVQVVDVYGRVSYRCP